MTIETPTPPSNPKPAPASLAEETQSLGSETPVASKADHAQGQNTHVLKSWPEYFERILDGTKPFEHREERFRKLPFKTGDILRLQEWEPIRNDPHCEVHHYHMGDGHCTCYKVGKYTGREIDQRVGYLMRGERFGLREGYVCMAITPSVGRGTAAHSAPDKQNESSPSLAEILDTIEQLNRQKWSVTRESGFNVALRNSVGRAMLVGPHVHEPAFRDVAGNHNLAPDVPALVKALRRAVDTLDDMRSAAQTEHAGHFAALVRGEIDGIKGEIASLLLPADDGREKEEDLGEP